MSDIKVSQVDPKQLLSLQKGGADQKPARSFGQTLSEAVGEVDNLQKKADQAIEDLAVGRRKTLHETLIQVEQASIAFQLFMSVRNKAVNAYQEVMRMNF